MNKFEEKVTQLHGVWQSVHDGLKLQFKAALKAYSLILIAKAKEFFEGIRTKFETLCSSKSEEDPMETELRMSLEQSLNEAENVLTESIRPALEDLTGDTLFVSEASPD